MRTRHGGRAAALTGTEWAGLFLALGIHGALAESLHTWRVPQDFGSIQAAVDAATPGDTILVRGPEDEFSEPVVFEENVVVTKPLTLSWNREEDGGYLRPVIQARHRWKPAITVAQAADVSLIGFCVRNPGGIGAWASRTRGLLIRDCVLENSRVGLGFDPVKNRGARDTRLFNNDIRSNSLCGITTAWNHQGEWRLHHNRIKGNVIGVLALPGVAAAPGLACRILDNDICGQTFAGLWLPTPPGLLEVLRNRVCDNHPYGVLIDQARQLRFASNLILGNSTGLWLWQGSAWNSPLNAAVYNNAVVGNRDYGVRLTAWRSGAGVQVLNNIVAFNAGKGLLVQGRPFQGVLAYNDFFQNAGGAVAGLAADPIGRQGNIAADPRFLDHNGALSGNYHLAPGSPCLHAGSPAPAFRNADGSRNTMGLYGGPERRPALGWATTWKGLALLYVDHGRGDVLLCHTNARGSICRANPFNGGAWVVANHYRPLEGSSIVAVDSQGRELQRFPGFTECLDIWQSVELSVDPRDGSCWVADTRDAFRHGGPGRLAKLTLDGRIAVDLEIPGLTDVEVARPDGLVAASAGESHAFVHFFTPDGTPVASADAGEGMAIGVAVNPPGGNLLLACDSHWAWLSLDDPGVVLQQAPARLGPRTSSVTVDPNSGRILMTAFAEEDTQLSLFAPDGVVLRNSNLQGRNCSPSLTSACDVDPRDSFFIGSCYLWGEEERRWLEGIAFLDPELVEPVSRLDGPCSSVSLLRP